MTIEIDVSRAYKQKKILKEYFNIENNIVKIKDVYIESKRVNDVIRYILSFKDNSFQIQEEKVGKIGKFKDKIISYKCNNESIVLIVESPHKDEYKNGKPIAPAQGTTGYNIRKQICEKLNRSESINGFKEGNYNLMICNPVQFQCSLFDFYKLSLSGSSPVKGIRDKVFKEIYKFEEKCFIYRLNSYSPKLVINASTSEVKPIVQKTLKENFKNILILEEFHPSNWN